MKIRVEGTEEETTDFAWKFRLNGLGFQINEVSKFYPNKQGAQTLKTGRLYIDIVKKTNNQKEP